MTSPQGLGQVVVGRVDLQTGAFLDLGQIASPSSPATCRRRGRVDPLKVGCGGEDGLILDGRPATRWRSS